jgi:hypothetical protein
MFYSVACTWSRNNSHIFIDVEKIDGDIFYGGTLHCGGAPNSNINIIIFKENLKKRHELVIRDPVIIKIQVQT